MRIIDTTQIVDPSLEQPLLGASLDFLTQNNLETLNSLVQNIIGPTYSATQVYILSGCVVTGVTSGSGNFAMTAGSICYGGEIFQVVAVTTIAVGSGNTVYSLLNSAATSTDPYTGSRALDPVTFSDGLTTKNVHLTRTWVTSILTTGSGTNPVSGWIPLSHSLVVGGTGVAFNTGWSNISTQRLWYTIRGGILYISGQAQITATAASSQICTLVAPFVPAQAGIGVGFVLDPSGTIAQFTQVTFSINTGGNILLNGYSGTITNQFAISIAIPLS